MLLHASNPLYPLFVRFVSSIDCDALIPFAPVKTARLCIFTLIDWANRNILREVRNYLLRNRASKCRTQCVSRSATRSFVSLIRSMTENVIIDFIIFDEVLANGCDCVIIRRIFIHCIHFVGLNKEENLENGAPI